MGNPVDETVVVIGNKQRTILRHHQAGGTAELRLALFNQPSARKILEANRTPIKKAEAHHFVAGRLQSIPGAVHRKKRVVSIPDRELGATIKEKGDRC